MSNLKLALILLVISLGINGFALKKDTIESKVEEYKSITSGDYDLTFKITQNGESKYLKFDGVGTSTVAPFNEYIDILYKGNNEEYKKLTDVYLFKEDMYINTSSLIGNIAGIPGMQEYEHILSGLDKEYMLVNDTQMKKAFEMYMDNDPNLAITSKARIITENETAFGIKDITSLRTQSNLDSNKDNKEEISIDRFIPTEYKGITLSILNKMYDEVESLNPNIEKLFGTNIITLDKDGTTKLLSKLKIKADNNELVQDLISEKSTTEFIEIWLEDNSELINSGISHYIESISKSITDKAITEIKFSNIGFKNNMKSGIYIRITTDGNNGFEMLYNNKQKIAEVDVERLMILPSDCFTVSDVFKDMAVKYLED